ncbi:prephenate dehydrogenase [Micromonospora mangrovi]|uniref:Prephenate dehydrogenase/arogenate dehydrogenase family protein n=2 Tax=Micromonospora TaxID=1873 RepID=A0AAU8HGF1_9ACTN
MTDGGAERAGEVEPSLPGAELVGVRAAVIGTGLIGGSVLLRLRDAGFDVTGWDPDPTTRGYAAASGVTCAESLDEAVAGRQVVFLCGPLPTLPETLLRVAGLVGERCVLTDVGSTKGELAAFAEAHGLTDRFVPGHPMAGTDRAGLTSADPALFDGAAWVLCPAGGAGTAAFRWLADLVIRVFRAHVVPMSPTEHDAVVALSSHVPHLLARALAGAVHRAELRDAVLGLAAGSFRDGTRVAATPSERTVNMLLGNRARVLEELARVGGVLDELAAALGAADRTALVELHEEGRAARTGLFERQLTRERREFAVVGEQAEELAWLLGLGSAGGHLTECRVVDGRVAYAGERPA